MNYYSLLLHELSIAFQPLDRTEPSFMTVNKLASNNKKVIELNGYTLIFLIGTCSSPWTPNVRICKTMTENLFKLPNELSLLHFC